LNKRVDHQQAARSRWFLLKGKNLYFFKDEVQRELLGSLDLRLMSQVSWAPNDDSHLRFFLKISKHTYFLEAKVKEEAEAWVQALRYTTTFGVPLEVLSKRKEGSHDKLVPLVLVKCLSYVVSHSSEIKDVFAKDGDAQMVQRLVTMFDQDDLSVNLNSLTTSPTEVASVAHLIKIFFKELPDPLFPQPIAEALVHIMEAFGDLPQMLSAFGPVLKQLSEHAVRTLKKLLTSLLAVAEKTADKSAEMDSIASSVAPVLIRSGTSSPAFAKMLTILIESSRTVFSAIILEVTPRKPARPVSPASPAEVPTIVEVFIDHTAVAFTFPVVPSTSAKDLCFVLAKKVTLATPSNLCEGFSLHEVASDYGFLFI